MSAPAGISPIFDGKVHGGIIRPANRQQFEEWLGALEGRNIRFAVWIAHQAPTLKQHAYYRVCVRLIAAETGYPERFCHRYLKQEFMPIGKSSTAKLTRAQFVDFLEHVLCFAAERNIAVPSAEKIYVSEAA